MASTHGSFESWMARVDALARNGAGVSVFDLADQPFRDYYDSDMSPSEAVEAILSEEF